MERCPGDGHRRPRGHLITGCDKLPRDTGNSIRRSGQESHQRPRCEPGKESAPAGREGTARPRCHRGGPPTPAAASRSPVPTSTPDLPRRLPIHLRPKVALCVGGDTQGVSTSLSPGLFLSGTPVCPPPHLHPTACESGFASAFAPSHRGREMKSIPRRHFCAGESGLRQGRVRAEHPPRRPSAPTAGARELCLCQCSDLQSPSCSDWGVAWGGDPTRNPQTSPQPEGELASLGSVWGAT